jgi:hypothetical protein
MKFENLCKLALVGIGLSVAGYAAYVLLKPKPKKKKSVTFGEDQIFEFQRDDNFKIFGNRKDPEFEWFEYEEAPISDEEFEESEEELELRSFLYYEKESEKNS